MKTELQMALGDLLIERIVLETEWECKKHVSTTYKYATYIRDRLKKINKTLTIHSDDIKRLPREFSEPELAKVRRRVKESYMSVSNRWR